MRTPARRVRGALLPLAAAITIGVSPAVGAGTFYEFAWSGNSFSATGLLELDEAVGVGDPFTTTDVLAFELELFDGSVSVAELQFPPFTPFHAIVGTRSASSLSMQDLVVSGFAILFGCEAGDCLSGVVLFDTPATPDEAVDFGSTEAARASFVFNEVPEPGARLSLVAVAIALASLRAARRPTPSPRP